MKVVEIEHYVPARTYIDKKYIASDGKEFNFESDCLKYEKQLAIENHPIYNSAVKGVCTFEEDYCASLYYISSQEDYEYFKETQGITTKYYFRSDFEKYGAGWYIFYVVDGGDYPDDKYLYNYDMYEKEIGARWEEYQSDMRERMERAKYKF